MLILAIDTSTEQGAVALSEEKGVLAEEAWLARGNHSRVLMRSIQHLFDVSGARPADLGALAVARGPGSFSGIRVGMSAASGFALGLELPLVGVGTLDLIGYQAAGRSDHVWAVLPAGRGEVFVAEYRGEGQSWRRIVEPHLSSVKDAASRIADGALLAGAGAELLARPLEEAGREVRSQTPAQAVRRASYLAELGRRLLTTDETVRSNVIEPLYLRRSAAEENRLAPKE